MRNRLFLLFFLMAIFCGNGISASPNGGVIEAAISSVSLFDEKPLISYTITNKGNTTVFIDMVAFRDPRIESSFTNADGSFGGTNQIRVHSEKSEKLSSELKSGASIKGECVPEAQLVSDLQGRKDRTVTLNFTELLKLNSNSAWKDVVTSPYGVD